MTINDINTDDIARTTLRVYENDVLLLWDDIEDHRFDMAQLFDNGYRAITHTSDNTITNTYTKPDSNLKIVINIYLKGSK